MKVIHVTHRAEEYGIGTLLIDLIECQKKNFRELNVGIAFHVNSVNTIKFEKLCVPVYSLGRKSAKDIRIFFQLLRIFKNFDIVNLHTYSPWAFLAALISRKKIVFTFHGALGLRKNWADVVVKLYYLIGINLFCEKITFASKSAFSRYLKGVPGNLKNDQIELFPYGTKISRIVTKKPREWMREELRVKGKFVVGTAARMDPMKKLDRLIEAFARLPGIDDFELIIVGSGEKRYRTFLEGLVAQHHLEKSVRFLGFRKDVLDIIGAFDLFVLPSKDEPFGIALLEAMALGIPSAAFVDGGGPVDILGKSGFIVNDPKELTDVILNLKDDNLLRQSVSRRVKSRAWQFDIRYTAERLLNIYKEIRGSS